MTFGIFFRVLNFPPQPGWFSQSRVTGPGICRRNFEWCSLYLGHAMGCPRHGTAMKNHPMGTSKFCRLVWCWCCWCCWFGVVGVVVLLLLLLLLLLPLLLRRKFDPSCKYMIYRDWHLIGLKLEILKKTKSQCKVKR